MSLEHFKTYIKDIHNLGNALAVLEWDQKTYMPSGGAEARAEQIAALSKVIHQMTTADEMGRLLEAAEAEAAALPYEHDDAALVRVLRREYDQQTRIPTDLVVEFRRATSLANAAWEQARAADDFASFFPHLEKIFELTGQQAEHLGYDEHIYDALLDQYEPGMTTADVRRVFDALRAQLVPLVQQISAQHDPTRADILRRDYAPQQQAVFGQMVIQKLGYDFTRGRQDETAHPFCIPFSQNDVRITTRYAPNWLPAALFGSIHETGHALYELGGAPGLEGTPLASGASLALHESQSRLWENVVGRSRGFWEHFYPALQAHFPAALGDVDLAAFYRAVNTVEPSLIRVEADEVTYSLHVMLRFDIETAVYDGKLAVKDIPAAWNAKMEDYLGITPPDDKDGCLQDIHWSIGIMGYFPTYALGNLLAVQFYERALQDHPSIPEQIARGEFGTLHTWLREHIYAHGAKFKPGEMIERITGGSIQTEPFMAYLTDKYSTLYDLN